MLSVVLSATTITMNRDEQENLFRQSRNLRLQQEAKQQQQLVLHQHQQQHQQYSSKPRHYSYGNIHQISNLHMQASNSRSFGDDRGSGGHQFGGVACDDLVLSVLKSPVKETTNLLGSSSIGGQTISASPSAGSNGLATGINTGGTGTATTQSPSPCAGYQALRGSEDDLVDDIESAIETTELNAANAAAEQPSSSPRALKFLRRFRTGKTGRFEPHHRRVPTPMRRKNRSRSRSRSNADILDGVTTGDDPCDVLPGDDDPCDVVGDEAGAIAQKIGVPDPYYPIALPIDQAFKAKYVFHHRRGKTVQERFYVFLEHPVGWLCFIYHFSV